MRVEGWWRGNEGMRGAASSPHHSHRVAVAAAHTERFVGTFEALVEGVLLVGALVAAQVPTAAETTLCTQLSPPPHPRPQCCMEGMGRGAPARVQKVVSLVDVVLIPPRQSHRLSAVV